jgi:hypothetical protein
MADKPQNKVAAVLRQYAEKVAAEKSAAGEGAPDRMTVADGQGGISTEKKQPPTDPGEGEVKRDQPSDGKNIDGAAIPGGSPDRLTVADGQGGITAQKGSPSKDPGETEVKDDQPADGEARKAAGLSDRAKRIRAAVTKANPALGSRFAKEADSKAPTQGKSEGAAAEKKAGNEGAPKIEFNQETLAKIASVILSTDEGIQFTHDLFEKQAGEAAARAQIADAIAAAQSYNKDEQIKAAAFNELNEKVASIHHALDEAGISEEDAGAILKQAAFHQQKIASYEHPMLKAAYVQGMDDAALLGAADEAAGAGAEGAPPVDEAMPMGGEELSEEEILALLEEMIANGEITEEDVMAAVQATSGGGGEGAAPAAPAPEEAAAAAGAAAGAPPM